MQWDNSWDHWRNDWWNEWWDERFQYHGRWSWEQSVLNDSPPAKFIDIEDLLQKVECRKTKIVKEDRNCYLVFNQVDFSNYHKIIDYRDEHRLHLRSTYFLGTETLMIIKIPSGEHEETHAKLSCMVIEDAGY